MACTPTQEEGRGVNYQERKIRSGSTHQRCILFRLSQRVHSFQKSFCGRICLLADELACAEGVHESFLHLNDTCVNLATVSPTASIGKEADAAFIHQEAMAPYLEDVPGGSLVFGGACENESHASLLREYSAWHSSPLNKVGLSFRV